MSIELPVIKAGAVIGKINIIEQTIEINSKLLVKYSCKMDGECCKRFNIPVTDFDIKRIEDHGYALDQIISDVSPFLRTPKTPFGSTERNYHIKRQPYTNACTFLKDGICSIHEFKPFGCRIFPFQYRFTSKDEVDIVIHESNFCPSVHSTTMEDAQNQEFLQYLLATLTNEINYRRQYFKEFGDSGI